MSAQQRAVLRRKKAYIADVVTRADELTSEMHSAELIDEETVKDLNDEKNPSSLVIRLIDAALLSPVPGAFDVFMNLLSKRHRWLVDELRMEYMYEQGSAAVDLEVAKEACSLVHKKFGSSKRFGEGDKKDIIDLLSVKIQLNNEEWQNRIQSTEDRVKHLENQLNHRDNSAHEISRSLRDFVREQDKRLSTHSHDMTTTSDIISNCILPESEEENDTLADLKTVVTRLLFRMEQILGHREALLEERSRCLHNLKIRDESVRADKAIKDVISTYNKQIRTLKHENEKLKDVDYNPSTTSQDCTNGDEKDILDLLEEKDSKIWKLTNKASHLEKENASQHKQIVELREELDNTRTEMISLRRSVRQLEVSLSGYKNKLERAQTVHFDDRENVVTEFTSNGKKKNGVRVAKKSSNGTTKLQSRPSTVH